MRPLVFVFALLTFLLFATAFALQFGFITPALVDNLTASDLAFVGILTLIAAIAIYEYGEEHSQ
jgi:hypothetical protein